jgi:hypothetical protein
MTATMTGSITYQALGISARRILDFLLHEHASHGGRENGNLAAPYLQLERWGVTAADVRKGFAELIATGFVVVNKQGLRVAGGGTPSRYALTWLPTLAGTPSEQPPSHRWQEVIQQLGRDGVGSAVEARKWLRRQTEGSRRGQRKRKPTPHLQVVSPLSCEAAARI